MRYHTIVADPPWPYSSRMVGTLKGAASPSVMRAGPMPYPTLPVDVIAGLEITKWAMPDAHLYLWATQRYLRDAFDVMASWGFDLGALLVWSKPPKGVVGTYVCSTEFCLFGRRGSLPHKRRHIGTCFAWPRTVHSAKPEAFLDLVESVSPGPYLELFARRQRIGWDTWGDEALEHVGVMA